MKNTMKKLLSLVLVAMLLVCAVPFQAAAAEETTPLTIKVYDADGNSITTKTYDVKADETVTLTEDFAKSLLTKDSWEFVKWTNKDGKDSLNAQISYNNLKKVEGDYYVNLYLKKKAAEDTRVDAKVPVKIFVDGSNVRDSEITVPVDGAVTLTKELGLKLVREDKEFVKWTGPSSDNDATDVTIKYAGITDGYFLKLYVNTKKAEEPVKPITVKIVDDKGNAIAKQFEGTPANGKSSVVGDILTQRWMGNWKDSYEFVTAKSDEKGGTLTLSTTINAGDTLTVTLKTKSSTGNNTTTNNKFPYKVYLHIFKDNKVDDPAKTINITEGIALDGKVTLDEVKTVVKNYYTAKTSDGIKYDGMYLAEGNWVGNFVNDTNDMRKTREVHINVMITNANAKNTTNEKADKTNPKTGDMIFIPVIFMVVSGAAIAGVYFYNKKRSAR